jgi:bifunctional DNA-binding transcriptional regulator/antitoxin component of YhaV-PrlF toxin-antitoxin module
MTTVTKTDTVHFSAKGHVVIPRWLRKQWKIEEGTRAVVCSTSEGILLKPITASHFRKMRGSLKGKGVLKAMMADRKREQEL